MILGLLVGVILITGKSYGQADPKKTPGTQVKILGVDLKKKLNKGAIDSTVDVKVRYVKTDGSKAELILDNVGYSKSPINHDKDRRLSGNKQ